MNSFMNGFRDELQKEASVLSLLGGKIAANAIAHAILNTNIMPPVRRALERGGDSIMAGGVRHGIMGKKIGYVPSTAIGVLASPSVPYMYDTGWKYGDRIRRAMQKVPMAKGTTPFSVIRGVDTAATKAMEAAPTAGLATGATYGYLTGRTKKENMPIKAILAGALTGGLLGKALQAAGPHAPIISQLKTVRRRVADPVLEGSAGIKGSILDALTRLP